MRLPTIALLALLSSGCATTGDGRLGWFCEGAARSGDLSATSVRRLDRDGETIDGETEWLLSRSTTPVPVEARFTFKLASGLPTMRTGRARFRFIESNVSNDDRQISLQSGDTIAHSGWSKGPAHDFPIGGRALDQLLARDGDLVLQLRSRSGALILHTGILRASFDEGLSLARQAEGGALAASADPGRLCQREQRIVPT